MDREKDAIAEYQKAVELKPNYLEAWIGLADAYYELNNYVEAVKAYTQARKLKNDNVDVLVGLGDSQRMSSDFNGAAGSYNQAITFITRRTFSSFACNAWYVATSAP